MKGCFPCCQIVIVVLIFFSRFSFAEKLAVFRGISNRNDFFASDSENTDCFNQFCMKAEAVDVTTIDPDFGTEFSCKCHCRDWQTTFLIRNKTCYSRKDLPNDLFETDGVFILDKIANMTLDGGFMPNKDCGGCKINSVKYLDYDQWLNANQSYWSIDTSGSFDKHKIKWKAMGNPSRLDGKILKIGLQNCKTTGKGWSKVDPQVFIKAAGKYSVELDTTTSSSFVQSSTLGNSTISTTNKPLPTSSVLSSISTHVIPSPTFSPYTGSCITSSSTVSGICPSSKTDDYPPTQKLTSTQLPGTTSQTGTAIAPSSTSSSVVSSTPATNPDRDKSGQDQSSAPTGAIVGAVLAVVAVLVIVVLVIIWRRRKGRQNQEKKKDTNKDNPAYGKRETINLSSPQSNKETSEFEYDYAAVDGDPRLSNGKPPPGIYQSLTHDPNTNRESVYTPLDHHQGNHNDEPASYDKIEHPVFKPAKKPTDPQYNVLQRPNKNKPVQDHTYLEPGAQIDPVYNVLEDPNSGGAVDEPEYNVLEGPNSGGANDDPDYNVLEDPNAQYEPEYHVLEDPQNNGPPKGHPSSCDNIGYASTIDLKPRGGSPVYAAPDSPISEPTYQPLTVNTPDDSVYQPLDRTSRNIPDDSQPVYHVLEGGTSNA